MAGAKKSQAKLDSFFFKAVQPPVQPVSNRSSPSTARQTPPPQPPHSSISSPNSTVISSTSEPVISRTTQLVKPQDSSSFTSKDDASESPDSPSEPVVQPRGSTTTPTLSSRIVKSSDDEDSDSDISLVDFATLLRANRPPTQQNPPAKVAPSTPCAPRFTSRNDELNVSPIVVPKYKFDLKTLANLAKADDAIEASSKRVKALSTPQEETGSRFPAVDSHEAKPNHLDLLETVVSNQEDGEMQRVTRALKRTEATLSEYRWYFFDTEADSTKRQRQPFPSKYIPEAWKGELANSKTRYQTFISGFAEDMVSYGKALPDEIFLWMFDELPKESGDPLRNSYNNILRESSEQVHRLVGRDLIQNLFKGLGGSHTGVSTSQKIRPIPKLAGQYDGCEWNVLCSVIKFLGQIARNLQQSARVYTICILLRMSIDRVVFDNLDVLDQAHETTGRLCRHIPDGDWESSCKEICSSIFECVDPATLRLQSVECVPSISPRTHDLRRRLAMCFYFDDISYSLKHSHSLMDLEQFITRLEHPTFDLTPPADYRELTALVSLLDIAVDDARSIGLDLTDRKQEVRFDRDVDDLAATIKYLMKSIGNPGAAFISKIEAKEALELVAQRISETLRSRPKQKETVFDGPPGTRKDDLEGERAGLQSFLSKMKKTETV